VEIVTLLVKDLTANCRGLRPRHDAPAGGQVDVGNGAVLVVAPSKTRLPP
jgi:hypothetical protein